MPRSSATIVALGLAGLAVIGSAGVLARQASPQQMLARGFGEALADSDTVWQTRPANIWLSNLGGPAAAGAKQMAIGDLITISSKSGHPQAIQVTELEMVDGASIGMAGVQLQLVTGQPRNERSASPVRFLFAIEAPLEHSPARVPRPADRVL